MEEKSSLDLEKIKRLFLEEFRSGKPTFDKAGALLKLLYLTHPNFSKNVGDAAYELEPDGPAVRHLVRRQDAAGLEVKLDKREKMTQFSLYSLLKCRVADYTHGHPSGYLPADSWWHYKLLSIRAHHEPGT